MGQHPITQRARSPSINLLAKRVRHHHRDTYEPDNPREPTQRQPCAREHRVEPIFTQRPEQNDCRKNRYGSAADMPRTREWIALVNVPPYGVCLVAEHKSLRWTNLTEVLDWIDAHERPRRTILFT